MAAHEADLATELSAIVAAYASDANIAALRARLEAFASRAPVADLIAVAEHYRGDPDVVAPLYERVTQAEPDNARALVILANAYWLTGRGPEVVGDLANRAIAADSTNRGAWHLWALSEPDPRRRVQRWQQVVERFPQDDLALAAVADNAAAVAGAEHDYDMLDLSIDNYQRLLERVTVPAQRDAVETALRALRAWRF